MRPTFLCVVLASFLLAVGCGESDKGGAGAPPAAGDSNAVPFQSKAKAPEGEVVKIAYQMEKGEGVRMKMTMRGTMKATGAAAMETPLDAEMAMTLECVEVKPNGDRVIEMSMESMKMAALGTEALPADMFDEFKGRVTIGADGKMKDIDYSGANPQISAQLDRIFKSPGFQSFIPMPPEGMRVGEALDLAKIMPAEAMEQLMNTAVPGGTLRPEIRGELVLMGTRMVDGEKSAEFAMNLVMNMAGSMSQQGQTVDMDFGITITGSQFSSLRTGFPMGTSEMKMSMRGDVEAQGETVDMVMDMTMTIDCSKL